MKNSIPILEPVWGKNMMTFLNDWMYKNDIIRYLVPYTADIFVFTYPVYLVGLYLWGIGKKDEYFKDAALGIFFSAGMASTVNYIVKFFGDKARPEAYIDNKQQLILSHLPTDPFPSDHAAVSAAIAMATLLWGIKHNDKRFIWGSLFFRIACLVMSFSRVTVAIHRPTDVFVGIGVGVLSALFIFSNSIRGWLKRVVFKPLIRLEKRLFKSIFGIDQS